MSSVVPEGWSKLMLGNIGTFSTSSVDKKSKDEETLVSLLNYMDIYRNSVLSSSYPFQSVTAPAKQVTSSSVRNGDVFFTPSSETPDDIGHSAVFIGDAESLVHSYHTIRFRPAANNHFDDNYKAFAFKGEETYEYFRKRATGSTRFTVSLPIFNELEVLCPPLPEQKKIASILTSVDEVIENTQKQIDKLQDLKKATTNDLLTKGIGHSEFKDSELGRIPKSWEITKISDVRDTADRYSFTGGPFGSNLKSEDYSEKGIRIIQLQNIGDGQFFDKYKIYTSKEKADELFSCNIYPGDIILSKMGDPVARATLIPDFDARYLMASDGIRLSLNKEKYSCKFILESINHHTFRYQAELSSTGSTRKRIGLTDLRTLLIACPILAEQKEIASILISMDKNIKEKQHKLTQTQSLKKSLMQDLLTGKVRVAVN